MSTFALIRKYPVFFRVSDFQLKKARGKPEEIVKNVFEDPIDYERLICSYNNALEHSKSNEEFELVYPASAQCFLSITDKIQVYYVQSPRTTRKRWLRKRNEAIPWYYPDTVTSIGWNLGCSPEKIVEDFVRLSFIDFFKKYNATNPLAPKCSGKAHDGRTYQLTDNLSVFIDRHITLLYRDNAKFYELYIADSWCDDDCKIVSDLCDLSMLDFGLKYKAYWSP